MKEKENKQLSNNFKLSEFRCKCGCGLDNINKLVVYKLQQVRDIYGKPIVITSGLRCIEWNKKQGGKENSAHITGLAVDVKCISSRNRFVLMKAFISNGFRRIGLTRNFIHVDNDNEKPNPVLFMYGSQPDKNYNLKGST